MICRQFSHCMKLRNTGEKWSVEGDAGNPYANQPYGYDPGLPGGPKGVLNLENGYYVEAAQLMEEAVSLILKNDGMQLSEKDIMPAVVAVKSAVVRSLGLTFPGEAKVEAEIERNPDKPRDH